MTWTHRPTWPDSPKSHATDRQAMYGDIKAGRVKLVEGGPNDGRWIWSALWANGVGAQPVNDRGTADTQEEALDAIRQSYLAVRVLRPDLDEKMREDVERTRHSRSERGNRI